MMEENETHLKEVEELLAVSKVHVYFLVLKIITDFKYLLLLLFLCRATSAY